MTSVDAVASHGITGELLVAAVACASTALLTAVFAHFAERRGFVDDGSEAPLRKLQERPVAPVGGAAIVCGCVLAALAARSIADIDPWRWIQLPLDVVDAAHEFRRRAWIAAALLAAFAVGLCDDLAPRGLSPPQKLGGQAIAGVLLGIALGACGASVRWEWIAAGIASAIVAQNALNTFDNADGAAAASTGFGFAPVAPVIACALLGFLPFNLSLGRAARDGRSTPRAYLGDSGSHFLGVLVLLHPQAALALAVPLLDLVRVAIVRASKGIAPWIGDRRHLAHRMLDRGWSPALTVLALCAIAAPILAAGEIQRELGGGALVLLAGAAGTLAAFVAALRACPARE